MKAFLLAAVLALLAFTQPARLVAATKHGAAESLPFHGQPYLVGERIEAEEFDLGGEGVAYHGEGAVVTAIVQTPWGLKTNVWSPLPRDRADADIAVGKLTQSSSYLGLRPKEWVQFSVSVETGGYHSFEVSFLGYRAPEGASSCGLDNGDHTAFEVLVDDVRVGGASAAAGTPLHATGKTDGVVIDRVWIPAGQHKVRLVGVWAPTYLWECDTLDSGWSFWVRRTCAIDWFRIVPTVTPVRPVGPGTGTGIGLPALLTPVPGGGISLWGHGQRVIHAVGADGTVSLFAGFAGNPPREGSGTNAGFAIIAQCLAAGSNIYALQQADDHTSLVSRVSPDGVVKTLFHGQLIIPSVFKLYPDGGIGYSNVPTAIHRLVLAGDGTVVAQATFESEWPNNWGGATTRLGYAEFSQRSDGSFQYLQAIYDPNGLPEIDSGLIRGGYRLDAGVLAQVTNGFAHPILEMKERRLTSAVATPDGGLWTASVDGWVYRLVAQPNGCYLRVNLPNDNRVEVLGVPDWAVAPGEGIRLEVKPKQNFWTLDSWSDGNANNPRTLSINEDTALTLNLVQRPPQSHGIVDRSFSLQPAGKARFAVIGPPSDGLPYTYLVEGSLDMATWLPVTGLRALTAPGTINGSYVDAARPENLVEMPLPASPAQRFFRVTLQY